MKYAVVGVLCFIVGVRWGHTNFHDEVLDTTGIKKLINTPLAIITGWFDRR